MTNAKNLLTDQQMQEFITNGFLILKTDFSEQFHKELLSQLNNVYQEEGNPGNNLLPRVKELQQVFDHPIVSGALTSVLGENYMLHAHRHGHFNNSAVPGKWHKDSYWGYNTIRHHRPWWAMVMYFPQDTPLELGPTGIMPGTQNHETRIFKEDEYEEEAKAFGAAGTFALIHYDIWHRSTANLKGTERYMLKFEFMRTQVPSAPSWAHQNEEWRTPDVSSLFHSHEMMWKDTWHWLRGESNVTSVDISQQALVEELTSEDNYVRTRAADELGRAGEKASQEVIQALAEAVKESYEPVALNAAYSLAKMGASGQQELLNILTNERVKAARHAAYGLQSDASTVLEDVTAALTHDKKEIVAYAAFVLGEQGRKAASASEALINALQHKEPLVRYTIVDALGIIQQPEKDVTAALAKCLKDEDVQVRFSAGLALIKLGPKAADAVPALVEALEDENRYVRAHALEALYYIGTPEAYQVLFHQLRNARWCTSTTPASTF